MKQSGNPWIREIAGWLLTALLAALTYWVLIQEDYFWWACGLGFFTGAMLITMATSAISCAIGHPLKWRSKFYIGFITMVWSSGIAVVLIAALIYGLYIALEDACSGFNGRW